MYERSDISELNKNIFENAALPHVNSYDCFLDIFANNILKSFPPVFIHPIDTILPLLNINDDQLSDTIKELDEGLKL